MLGTLAVLPVALPAAAESSADPVFGLIEAHRAANLTHLAAIDEAARLEDLHGDDWGHITDKPCHDENEALEILLRAAATTLPGLLGKLAYFRAISQDERAWMLDEREGIALDLIESFAGSIRAIWGVQA